jgi:CheY-like chemotaxis protein
MEKKRVLVVDDEEDLTWSIAKNLARDEDRYELITVNSGKEALGVLSQLPVDLVVSDVRMPEISGLDLLLKIKENYPLTKVIIMTAYGSSEVQDEASSRGCFKYIEKPFEMSKLRELILSGIEQKKGFEGRISDFQLSDLIQMNCLGRLTNAIFVEKDDQKGSIFFEDGNIVHAAVDDDMVGENAFYEILTWQGGSFSVEKSRKAEKETIRKGWQTLLLEGMRRADEIRTPEKQNIESELMRKKQEIINNLDKFVKTKGVILVSIFTIEGFPTSSKIGEDYKDKYDISSISPVISGLMKHLNTSARDLGFKELKGVMMETQDGFLILETIQEKNDLLLVLADNTTNHGLLKMEIKTLLKRIVPLLPDEN